MAEDDETEIKRILKKISNFMTKIYNHLHSRREFLGVFAAAIPLLSFGQNSFMA